MQYHFEIYTLSDHVTDKHWDQLYKAILVYVGVFGKFEITFTCSDHVVRFYVSCDKDLSSLSNTIEGMLLRPADKKEFLTPKYGGKERMVQFVTGGNILDLKEKYSVKKAKDLEYATLKIRVLSSQKSVTNLALFFKDKSGQFSKSQKLLTFFPAKLLEIDFENNTHYLKRKIPKYLDIQKSLHMLTSDSADALFQVDTFPYFSHDYYLNLGGYEFDKHSFIIGASGSGKSKFISLMVDRIARIPLLKNGYRIVVIDPHASLVDDFSHLPDSTVITFGKSDSTDLFPGAGTDLTAATELTASLFKSILADQFNPRVDRLLRFSLFALMTAQAMSLENLKRFLTDIEYRNQILDHIKDYVPHNIIKFFGADFNELRTHYYNETILPIVSMVDEMQLQPSLVGENETSLAKTVQDNFLTVFSLNKVSMGDKVVKTVAGLLIQQIFLLAQARAFGQKVILIIDEVSVVQNPTLAQILAEARKFNLTVILTQQYFGQVEKGLRDAIFANVYNYYAFKVSEEDARGLEGNLNIELPKELIESEHAKGIKEIDIKVKMLTELHPRECLVRVLSRGQIAPAFKARTMDAPKIVETSTPQLQPVKQMLPDKFKEGASGNKPAVHFSEEFIEQLASRDQNTLESRETEALSMSKNIQDLLAAHSSSRDKLKRKKD